MVHSNIHFILYSVNNNIILSFNKRFLSVYFVIFHFIQTVHISNHIQLFSNAPHPNITKHSKRLRTHDQTLPQSYTRYIHLNAVVAYLLHLLFFHQTNVPFNSRRIPHEHQLRRFNVFVINRMFVFN